MDRIAEAAWAALLMTLFLALVLGIVIGGICLAMYISPWLLIAYVPIAFLVWFLAIGLLYDYL